MIIPVPRDCAQFIWFDHEGFLMKVSGILENARSLIDDKSPRQIAGQIEKLVAANETWRSRCLNLDAAESADSPVARRFLASDFSRRSFIGEVGQRKPVHAGSRYYDEIEALTYEMGRRLFHCEFFEFRPMTASVSDGLCIRCLTELGDTIMALEKPFGHATWREEGYPGDRGLRIIDIPFDTEEFNIDLKGFKKAAAKSRARLIIVGTSLFLFPQPLRELKTAADELGAKLWYDGAHVMGLIAGGAFQDPLREGADLLTGSGKKTLSGPSGGIIVHNDVELERKIRANIYGHVASIITERIPALAVALAEMLEFGKEYAAQIVANAKALGSALDREALDVKGKTKGYTASHTLAVGVEAFGGGDRIAERLERANIIVSPFKTRRTDSQATALRIGTAEMTRFGMKQQEMKEVGRLIRRVVVDEESPRKVAEDVEELRRDFQDLHYCFKR